MRFTALGAGVLLSFVIISVNADNVGAQAASVASLQPSTQNAVKAQPEEPATPPVPAKHIVNQGENLSKIAEKHQTTWKRIYDKNTEVADPDIVTTGQELVIPLADEQLAERELPVKAPPVQPVVESRSVTAPVAAKKPAVAPKPQNTYVSRGSSSGNTYTAGNCTWYAKSRRPDLPNNLGNAETWVSRAAAQGLATGSTPQAGAIGQRGNHVVYVDSVNGDGTVNITEMNRVALYQVTSRTVPASYFMYIY
jgi:surface antigen